MKLLLTTNNGEVLDSMTLSAAEYRQEARRNGIVAALIPGENVLDTDDTPED